MKTERRMQLLHPVVRCLHAVTVEAWTVTGWHWLWRLSQSLFSAATRIFDDSWSAARRATWKAHAEAEGR